LEETEYWLDLLGEAGLGPMERVKVLKQETNELIAIFVSIVRQTKLRSKTRKL